MASPDPSRSRPRWVEVAGALLANVGPLVVFYGFDWTLGLKPAIVATALFSMGEVAWRLWRREPITFLFKVTATSTVGLGLVDIVSQNPRFLSYEAFLTNAAFGGWFAWLMAKGPEPFVEEIVRQRPELGGRTDLVGRVRVLLAMIVAYHVVTAGVYLWIAARYPVEEAVGLRALFGNASLVPFVAAVWFGLAPLHAFAARRGWVEDATPASPDPASPPPTGGPPRA